MPELPEPEVPDDPVELPEPVLPLRRRHSSSVMVPTPELPVPVLDAPVPLVPEVEEPLVPDGLLLSMPDVPLVLPEPLIEPGVPLDPVVPEVPDASVAPLAPDPLVPLVPLAPLDPEVP